MNKLTAEVARQDLNHLKSWVETCGISMKEERYMQALEIALPILEQQESVKKLPLRDGIEAIRKSTADSGGYDFNALREHQEMGEWIEWSGGECPVDDSTIVDIKHRDGRVAEGEMAGNYIWTHGYYHYLTETAADIISYRIIPEQPTNQNGEQ